MLSDGNAETATDAQLMMNNDPTYFMTRATAIAADKAQYYQCEIRTNTTRVYRPYIRVPLVLELKNLMKPVYSNIRIQRPTSGIYTIHSLVRHFLFWMKSISRGRMV